MHLKSQIESEYKELKWCKILSSSYRNVQKKKRYKTELVFTQHNETVLQQSLYSVSGQQSQTSLSQSHHENL